jgi:UDP-galactopyranose mutase
MVISHELHAGQNHNIKGHNKSFERVEEFKYLGTNLTNQNCIHEEIKSRVKSGNASYYSVHNRLSSILLSKNIKIKIHRSIILPVVL